MIIMVELSTLKIAGVVCENIHNYWNPLDPLVPSLHHPQRSQFRGHDRGWCH